MLAASVLDVVEVIVFGALGFLIVVVVCAVILAFLQLILPKTDTGAEAAAQAEAEDEAEPPLDTEANA